MNNNLLYYYGRVSIYPFKAYANLVNLEGMNKHISAWAISSDQVSEWKLSHGDIVRAKVPSLDSEYCSIIEKVIFE